MDSILSKLGMFFATILAVVSSSSYIYLEKTTVDLSWKTGDSLTISTKVALKNVGSQKARFDVSSSQTWANVYREDQYNDRSFDIFAGGAINLIIEIQPQELTDGPHQAAITVTAVNDLDNTVHETQTLFVNVNKNYTAPSTVPTSSVTVSVTPSGSNTATPTPSVAVTATPAQTPSKTPTAPPRASTSATPKTSTQVTPGASKSPAVTLIGVSPTPGASVTSEPNAPSEEGILERVFKKILSWFGFGD